jgi:hypothetical protein
MLYVIIIIIFLYYIIIVTGELAFTHWIEKKHGQSEV